VNKKTSARWACKGEKQVCIYDEHEVKISIVDGEGCRGLGKNRTSARCPCNSRKQEQDLSFEHQAKISIDDGEGGREVGEKKELQQDVHASSKNKFCIPDEHEVMVSLKWWRKGKSSWLDKEQVYFTK